MSESRPLRRLCLALALLAGAAILPAVPTSAALPDVRWSDVPRHHWARRAIDYVGAERDWMRDLPRNPDGTYPFQPDALETRALLARAVVRAFAPDETPDPGIAFSDLPAGDPFYDAANVAVKLGWMQPTGDQFQPTEPATTRMVHRALVLALGLSAEAAGLDHLHTRNGVTFDTPPDFGTLLLGMRLGLRYNHADDSLDVGPDSPLSRAEVAWSLYRAATAPRWAILSLAPYAGIELPFLGLKKQRIVRFGIRYVGYPYVWGGEWDQPSPEGYCCGTQPVGGFDCSGLVWWVMKLTGKGWDNVPPRDYRGWPLPERSSADMAAVGDPIPFEDVKPGDLLFSDGDGDGIVDHVNVYLGAGWALDSSSGYAGVSILEVDSGWYRDHFVGARRIIGKPSTSPPGPSPSPSPSPAPGS